MNSLSKYEAVGIFSSIAVMALALAVIRFSTDGFSALSDREPTEEATVIAANDAEGLRDTLTNDLVQDGTLDRLIVNDIQQGSGEEVENGNTVTVNYIGTLQDGTQFDNSYTRGEPFSFTVGEGKVIAGWEKGILGMKEGGERILVIPSELAYGNRQVGPIPPNSPLVFAIELLEIK